MPRNVRNFWIEADIEGRRSRFASGPVRKDGGFSMRILIRNNGTIEQAVRLEGIAHEDGRLELCIFPKDRTDFARFAADGCLTITAQR